MTEILQTPKLVVVFGGSGFVGRHVVRALAKRGYRIRVACRRPDLAGHLQPLGNVGQIQPVQANVRVRWSVDRAVQGADRARGLTHISALGADLDSESDYARTKALGEKAVLETIKDAVIFRPSINFGPEDGFFNRFANMARYSPVLPLIGGGQTKFQPVYVGDVAEAVARSVDGKVDGGQIYELGGPKVLTFKQCMEELLDVIERKRLLVPVPWWVANIQASILGLLPNPLLTKDQVMQLREHNIVSDAANQTNRTLAGLGIQPQSIATILPSYLWRYRAAGQFQQRKPAA
ncbi:complex I NDUFA9 subunit family protein [Mesorhizobium sp. M7A.F.Ca.US.014.04.1.1]|uniref:complex I NDUFA9 subunit family protein n=1 Tax=Mesorhizobium sp. M7A.F.Ca.US.014.04.1.1 TaxID=2496744 RepID=UPI000FCC623C|nr:complex I NDUFA9 subunit family protein [Mesorhizobium sp. M7A.F.Ca.US.014.04.1.1]RUX65498.1 complex I NDUFA9 subunit family protein [Mesorhizobium sp. M7A.F.Ca.US.014.04.1.1]